MDYLDALRRDVHVHTTYCRHAVGSMEDYVLAALDAGFEELGFLEHAEAGIHYPQRTWLTAEELDQYWEEGQALARLYEGQIRVGLGLELGLNPGHEDELLALAGRHPWTRVGLSCHFHRDGEDTRHLNLMTTHNPDNVRRLRELDARSVALACFDTLRKGLPVIRPDMLCHLDAIRRTIPEALELEGVREAACAVLDEVARLGVVLEVNTAGYVYSGTSYPDPALLREALRRGIRLAFSSDSHEPSTVGRYFDRAREDVAAALRDLA